MTHHDNDQGREAQERILKRRSSDYGVIPAVMGAIFVVLLLIAFASPPRETPTGSRQSGIDQSQTATSPGSRP